MSMKMRARVTETTRIEWNGMATYNVWQSGWTAQGAYYNENVGCFTNYVAASVSDARAIAEAWWAENKEDYPEER